MIKRGSFLWKRNLGEKNRKETRALILDRYKNLVKSKRSQQLFGMPFSVIFSIFLIVIFLVVAFFAIKYVWGIFGSLNTADFIDSLGGDVESARNSAFSSNTFEGNLPPEIEYVCFADLSKESSGNTKEKEIYSELRRNADYTANLFFYPPGKTNPRATNIEYVDFSASNPYCFEVKEGSVKIKLEKGRFDSLVKVSRV